MRYYFSITVLTFGLVISSLGVSAQVINAGVGGNNTMNLLHRLNKDVLEQHPDLVILMVGTNDMLNSKKMISYKKYEDNLVTLVRKIKEKGSEIVLMSPPPADSVYLFERHDKNLFNESPNEKLDSVRKINLRIAVNHDLKFIDLYQVFTDLNLPKHNTDLFIRNQKNSGVSDGVHPTELGYHLIGEIVFYFLKENQLVQKQQKIVCFGDSITKGSGAKGKTYPVILQNLINDYDHK
ncbi:hypothetical protein JBL43_17005 [Aureibaculum sp. A20]|uniref:SGNH hydrolase-type esterase domain-containing protein n=1 Tax=Aureibaculum flavum TaxID=2795986 RepID=A0ABS0WVH5_9FLAO|nr:GDSL-type esterase/lipase family protein [Aureibaculum flavum]MBJ2175957.1 hypothetical protein [Aureibaculum flavum]